MEFNPEDQSVPWRRLNLTLRPEARRVLVRPFFPTIEPRAHNPTDVPRALKIMSRVLSLPGDEAEAEWAAVERDFGGRHPQIENYLLRRFESVRDWLPTDSDPGHVRKLLIGAYFTHEYAIEAAALFNPSIVPCPDQSNLSPGALRFVLSLRSVGEGHISSITFRCGTLEPDFSITMGESARWAVEPEHTYPSLFDAGWFEQKSAELSVERDFTRAVLDRLPREFSAADLEEAVRITCGNNPSRACLAAGERLMALVRSNFSLVFDPEQRYSERVIFPVLPAQSNGIEDARFVRFTDDDGSVTYYATYTAYDGRTILPQMLETKDFLRFDFHTLQGPAVHNKGMALFPRKIDGRYLMLGRQDNENIRLMYSSNPYYWDNSEVIVRPTRPWEFVQLGNCGSPIELDEGWLVITHGVGAMRRYCLGALLLDKNDPSRILGRLKEPLIKPAPDEREGYVPNVVYTCGALVHAGHLILPYATSDWYTSFAAVEVSALLDGLLNG